MLAGAFGVVEDGVAAAGGEPAVVVEGGYVKALAEGGAAAADHGEGDGAAEDGAEVAGGDVAAHGQGALGAWRVHHVAALRQDLGRVVGEQADELLAVRANRVGAAE